MLCQFAHCVDTFIIVYPFEKNLEDPDLMAHNHSISHFQDVNSPPLSLLSQEPVSLGTCGSRIEKNHLILNDSQRLTSVATFGN